MEEALKHIGDAGIIMGGVFANLFVIFYQVLARWWKHGMGIHIFCFMLAIALTFDHATLNILLGGYPGSQYVRAVLFPSVGAVFAWRFCILIAAQIKSRREKSPHFVKKHLESEDHTTS